MVFLVSHFSLNKKKMKNKNLSIWSDWTDTFSPSKSLLCIAKSS